MNKLLSIVSLCALFLAPGCRNLYIWNKPEKKDTTVVRTSKKKPTKNKKEKKRISGPKGWNIDMTKE